MADAVRKYLDAMHQLDEVTDELGGIVSVIGAVAEALKSKPARFMFSDITPELPSEVVLGHATRVEGDKWPSAEKIQDLLLRWHTAKKQALAAWSAISKSDQSHLKSPDH
jgi:hypothetical protein